MLLVQRAKQQGTKSIAQNKIVLFLCSPLPLLLYPTTPKPQTKMGSITLTQIHPHYH